MIRQFVAMPLGAGYTAEEQISGEGKHGGLQAMVYPMKREAFERRFPPRPRLREAFDGTFAANAVCTLASPDMGMGAGGRMRQDIYADEFVLDEWDTSHPSRCFVHLANSLVWRAITGESPPTTPPTSAEYTRNGFPWFDYYGEGAAVDATRALEQLRSVLDLAGRRGDVPLPENEPVAPDRVIKLRPCRSRDEVREGVF